MYRVAVVGAGPSGLYAAAALLTSDEPVSVEVLDRLPAPYGLVRYGVAPDHVKMKSVIRVLQRLAGQRVQRAEWLVEEQHGRLGREGARDRDPLTHAARQLAGPPLEGVRQADLREGIASWLEKRAPQFGALSREGV